MLEKTTQRRSATRPYSPRFRATAPHASLLAALLLLCGSNASCSLHRGASDWVRYEASPASPALMEGAQIMVALGCNVSSGTARAGDAWHGTVTEYVRTLSEGIIPPGSEVSGVVTAVSPARWGTPAMLQLCIRSIRVNGRDERIAASSDAVVAGTAVSRDVCPTAAGCAADSPGCQVVLHDVLVMKFTVDQTVAMR